MTSKKEASSAEIQRLRKEYSLGGLLEENAAATPIIQFQNWFDEALQAHLIEPNAMILSTVGADHKPSSRAVLMKQFTEDGLTFFSNYESLKGRQIETNPWVSVVFLWAELERQVRIEGKIEKTSRKVSEDYFHSRPLEAQLSAASSPQSSIVASRLELEELRRKVQQSSPPDKIACPEHWGGYLLRPDRFEFWQGRTGRLHDRLEYLRKENSWILQRLAP